MRVLWCAAIVAVALVTCGPVSAPTPLPSPTPVPAPVPPPPAPVPVPAPVPQPPPPTYPVVTLTFRPSEAVVTMGNADDILCIAAPDGTGGPTSPRGALHEICMTGAKWLTLRY